MLLDQGELIGASEGPFVSSAVCLGPDTAVEDVSVKRAELLRLVRRAIDGIEAAMSSFEPGADGEIKPLAQNLSLNVPEDNSPLRALVTTLRIEAEGRFDLAEIYSLIQQIKRQLSQT